MSQYIDSITETGDNDLLTVWGTMVNTRDLNAPVLVAPSAKTSDNTMLYLAAAGVIIAAITLLKKG